MKYGKYTGDQWEDLGNRLGGEQVIDGILTGMIEFVAKVKDTAVKVVSFITNTYKQVVDYDLSIPDLLKAGKYDDTNSNITDENFLSAESGKKEVEFGMYHFGKVMDSSEDVIAEMKKDGYRPATMKELLSFGKKNKNLQKKFPIIALGSVAELGSNRRVGALYGRGCRRYAFLSYFDFDWHDDYRFLAVRN